MDILSDGSEEDKRVNKITIKKKQNKIIAFLHSTLIFNFNKNKKKKFFIHY